MPFPLKTKMQMPCQHWNHFPTAAVTATGKISESTPPSPEQMPYCKFCRAQEEKQK